MLQSGWKWGGVCSSVMLVIPRKLDVVTVLLHISVVNLVRWVKRNQAEDDPCWRWSLNWLKYQTLVRVLYLGLGPCLSLQLQRNSFRRRYAGVQCYDGGCFVGFGRMYGPCCRPIGTSTTAYMSLVCHIAKLHTVIVQYAIMDQHCHFPIGV